MALQRPTLARSDSAGASHALAEACRETRVRFSFGYAMDVRVREAILALPEAAWRPAINADGHPREGAWVAELTGHVSLDAWPQGSRLIVRRERPHPERYSARHDQRAQRSVASRERRHSGPGGRGRAPGVSRSMRAVARAAAQIDVASHRRD
jgi:hypothetical protein